MAGDDERDPLDYFPTKRADFSGDSDENITSNLAPGMKDFEEAITAAEKVSLGEACYGGYWTDVANICKIRCVWDELDERDRQPWINAAMEVKAYLELENE